MCPLKTKHFKLHKELAVEEHLQTQILGRWGQKLHLKIGRQAGRCTCAHAHAHTCTLTPKTATTPSPAPLIPNRNVPTGHILNTCPQPAVLFQENWSLADGLGPSRAGLWRFYSRPWLQPTLFLLSDLSAHKQSLAPTPTVTSLPGWTENTQRPWSERSLLP